MTPVELKLYRANEWYSFREEIFEIDGYACRRCHKTQADGAILQVHHLAYHPRRLPWEYPPSACEALCKGCHAEQHGIIKPAIGWELLGRDDSGDLCEQCEYCGTDIRYVFHIWHPKWEPLAVGEICCDNLTGTELASNFMESQRRFQSRLNRFISSKRWEHGSHSVGITQGKIRVEVRETVPSGFQIYMNWIPGRRVFATQEEAKTVAFEAIESGAASRYLQKHSGDKASSDSL